MKIVIDVPEKVYNHFCRGCRFFDEVEEAIIAITDGTPLPKGHGDIVDINHLIDMFWDGGYMEITKYDLPKIKPIIEADKAESEGEK